MSKFSEAERNKSIIGNIKGNRQPNKSNSVVDKDQLIKDPTRLTLEQKAKKQNLDFFSLDETDYKLKKADWLDIVYFEPLIPEFTKRQSLYFNSQ